MTVPVPAPAPTPRARLLAFYLPQFHPIPENDAKWGKGFTEWHNVAGARPTFRGHRQPRVPGDLGFYDLRLPETRAAQAELAARHGIEGFCYWHYWFNGTRLLDRPFAEVLASGEPDFPVCLAWANQAWTDTWLGTGTVLQAQEYSPHDDVAHARWLTEAFADRRYVRIDGRPVFIVYNPGELPDPARTVDTIRSEVVRAGVTEPLILGIDSYAIGHDYRTDGFDGTVAFEPNLGLLPHNNHTSALARPWRKVARTVRNVGLGVSSTTIKAYSYRRYLEATRRVRSTHEHPYYPGILVGWDNTPRRADGAIVMVDDDVRWFEQELERLVAAAQVRPADDRVIFVNAWNEWAEGNFLEPVLDRGSERLEAVARVVLGEVPAP
jgi:hypothetical protein